VRGTNQVLEKLVREADGYHREDRHLCSQTCEGIDLRLDQSAPCLVSGMW